MKGKKTSVRSVVVRKGFIEEVGLERILELIWV